MRLLSYDKYFPPTLLAKSSDTTLEDARFAPHGSVMAHFLIMDAIGFLW